MDVAPGVEVESADPGAVQPYARDASDLVADIDVRMILTDDNFGTLVIDARQAVTPARARTEAAA